MTVAVYQLTPVLPWAKVADEDKRYQKILGAVLAFFLLSSLTVSFIVPVPKIDREKLEEIPPRLAKLILERKKLPPPPPPKSTPKIEKKPEPKQEKPKPKPKPKAKPKPSKVKVKKSPSKVKKAREKALKSGLLAMRDKLAALRDPSAVNKLKQQKKLSTGGKKAKKSERKLLTKKATTGSGGITAGKVTYNAGGKLGSRSTTLVDNQILAAEQAEEAAAAATRERSLEEIKEIFDRNKGAIYALYNRALRKDPSLQGRVLLSLVIDPEGNVIECKVVSSDLNSTRLERRLVARIKLINFGSKDVLPWKNTYHIDFLPS